MNFGPNTLLLADTLDARVAKAALQAISAGIAQGLTTPTIGMIREAAVKHRARLAAVAATTGQLRCLHCGTWIHAGVELFEGDSIGCGHVGDVDNGQVFHSLALWQAAGGVLTASHILPDVVAKRLMENDRDAGRDTSSRRVSPSPAKAE